MGESAAADKSGIIKYLQGDGTGTGKLLFGNWGDVMNTQSLCVEKGGNVGIGTTTPEKTVHIFEGGLEIEEKGTGSIDSVPIPEINLRQSRYANTHTNDRTVGILKFINSGPRYNFGWSYTRK